MTVLRTTTNGLLRGLMVVRFRLQPLAMLPESPGELSKTYNDHVPFGLDPSKVDNNVPCGPAGAGGGRLAVMFSVGLKVPDTIWLEDGKNDDAVSSKVRVTFVMAFGPPVPAMSTELCPAGPVSNISTSFGNAWLKLLTVTVTSLTIPVTPKILIVDGYGVPGPLSGISMGVVFAKVVVAGKLKLNATVPKLVVPS